MKHTIFAFLFLTMLSCAAQNPLGDAKANRHTTIVCNDVAGFWDGLGNGLVAGLAFIVSIWDKDTGIYNPCNNGGWYDFGFALGIGALGGGIKASSTRRGR